MTTKLELIDYLTAKRESAIKDQDFKTAYAVTIWINFVNRTKSTADIHMTAYLVKQDKQNQAPAQLTLF